MIVTIKRNNKPSPFLLVQVGDLPPKECELGEKIELKGVERIEVENLFHLLTMKQKVSLIDWAYKALPPEGQLRITVPSWCHSRSFIDPGVQWPPVSGDFFMLTNKKFRELNFPHVEMVCDYIPVVDVGYDSQHPDMAGRNEETKGFMFRNYINAALTLVATLKKV